MLLREREVQEGERLSGAAAWNAPRGPTGEPLADPKPCKTCKRPIVFIEESFLGQPHPIEWEGGRNHFLRCPGTGDYGQPGRLMSYCFKHRVVYNAKGPGCTRCVEIARAKKDALEWRTRPPLEKFG